jgi:hypothetical protein
MKHVFIRHSATLPLVFSLLFGAAITASAQVDSGPPKLLVIQREYLKPAKPAAPTRNPRAPSFAR